MSALSSSPKVFVSYSHDSELHKDWVRSIAERLVGDGVDVVLDQWEIQPGDDVTAFMERGLNTCDRVLIVCTDNYVAKANTIKAGVGYERMIITAEIAKDLETKKFIPVLRSEKVKSLPRFLGTRIYVDFRSVNLNDAEYERLLRTLLGAPKHTKPPLGKNPYQLNEHPPVEGVDEFTSSSKSVEGASQGKQVPNTDGWRYHWHRSVHEYCGSKLYLILLKFSVGSIFFKESVLKDIGDAGITDYMSFHLFSHWDVLIRVWADARSIALLRERLAKNHDLHPEIQPLILIVEKLTHFPDGGNYPTSDEVFRLLNETPLAVLKDVQGKSERSPHFRALKIAGLILDDTVRFHPERIQFYIGLRSPHPFSEDDINRLVQQIAGQADVFNKSFYRTSGSAIEALIKGQAENYYAISGFLRAITQALKRNVTSETMLVAHPDVNESTLINLRTAETFLTEVEFQRLIPDHASLELADRLQIQSQYARVRDKRRDDPDDILAGLLQARAAKSTKAVRNQLSFFPPLEEAMRNNLVPTIVREFAPEQWQNVLDRLKEAEGLGAKATSNLVFGDLCKLYRRLVFEKAIIDASPLTPTEFAGLMDAAPTIRNDFAHREADISKWDHLFAFCSDFVPIKNRLLKYFDRLKSR